MAENMKPVEPVFKTDKLFEIVNKASSSRSSSGHSELAMMKRTELLSKMKSEKDKRDYMILFNILMTVVIVSSFVFFLKFYHIAGAFLFILALIYFIFIRRRLTQATLSLTRIERDSDEFLWEGYYLKEMRFSAVKLAYFLFFPAILIFGSYVLMYENVEYFWTNTLLAYVISSIAWLVYFFDDQTVLDQLESELNTLKYL
jgi:hypothetical protein